MKHLKTLIFILILSLPAFAQNIISKQVKAQEVLEKVIKAVNKRKIDIAGLSMLSSKQFTSLSDTEGNVEIKLEFSAPDKFFYDAYEHYTTNDAKSKIIINGENVFAEISAFTGDHWQDFTQSSSKEDNLKTVKDAAFECLFPVSFQTSWFYPFDFSYVGVAESKDGRANVIEATSSNKRTYRLLFDEKTNLLLLMIKTWTNTENQPRERKYFYSDYKEIDGLYVATTIKVEDNGKLAEVRAIKSLKVNPTFKANYFEIKKPLK